MMKKWTEIVIAIMACMVLIACGNTTEQSNNTAKKNDTEVSESIANNNTEITSGEETDQTESSTENMSSHQVSDTENKQNNDVKDTIIVYFSATGTTKGLAQQLADAIDADIFEIVPSQPYTDADLDYRDDNSRSTLEMNDPSSRPEISGQIDNFEQYRNVIIGYPIWWSDAPRIMSTFAETYNFTGKTVLPFCTSGGSGIGSSAKKLEKLAGSGTWLDGQRFTNADDLISWVESNISE